MPICSSKIPFNSIQNHLSTHGVMGNSENAKLPNIQEVTITINMASINICIWAWPVHLCHDEKNFFGMCEKYSSLNGLFLWIYGLGMEEESKQYQAIIEVSNPGINKVRKLSFDCVISISNYTSHIIDVLNMYILTFSTFSSI